MSVFGYNQNNGACALWLMNEDGGFDKKPFVFANKGTENEQRNEYVSGSLEDMDVLIGKGKHRLIRKGGYVPFSNQHETGLHGDEARMEELQFSCACPWEIRAAFGREAYDAMIAERRRRFREAKARAKKVY